MGVFRHNGMESLVLKTRLMELIHVWTLFEARACVWSSPESDIQGCGSSLPVSLS